MHIHMPQQFHVGGDGGLMEREGKKEERERERLWRLEEFMKQIVQVGASLG